MTTPDARRAAALQLHDAFVKTRGEQWLRFQGGSMAPTLREGDLLSVRYVAADELAFGDIVVFEIAEASVVHRLLGVPRLRTPLVTKGDNAWRVDRPFAPDRLVGKVCTVRRGTVRIDLEHGRWRWVSRAIALVSLLEAGAFSFAVAVRRRWQPAGPASRGVERRVLRLLGGCRQAVIGALLRMVPHGEGG
jgi:signal peptidase I